MVALKGVSINDQLRDILGTFYMQLSDWRYGIYTYILSGGKSGKKCTDPNQKPVGIIIFIFSIGYQILLNLLGGTMRSEWVAEMSD